MAEPEDLTRAPNGSFVPITWAEGGAVTEPSAGRKTTGWQAADVVTKEELNWLSREPYRWLRALASRYVESSDGFSSSWFVPNGSGVWSTDGVGALQGFLSDDPLGTDSLVADVWADPDDVGAVRVQVNVPKAGPHTFTANVDTYIFVPIDLIAPPTVSEVELTYVEVPVGDPAPVTPGGTVGVWRVETDGATIVDQEILLVSFPVLKQIGFEVVSAATAMIGGDLDVGGTLEVGGDLSVDGNSILGDSVADAVACSGDLNVVRDLTVLGSTACGDAGGDTHVFTGLVTANTGITVAAGTLQANDNVVLGDGAGKAVTVNGTTQHNAPVTFASGAAVANTQTLSLTGSANIVGGSGSSIAADIHNPGEIQFVDRGTSLATVNGALRWNETFFAFRDATGALRTLNEPSRGYDATFTTGAAIANTTASAARRIKHNEPVWIEVSFRFAIDAVPNDVNVRIQVSGGLGSAEPFIDAYRAKPVANAGDSVKIDFSWTPTDSFAAVAPDNYSFLVRIGTTGGNVTAEYIGIQVSSSVQV